MIRKKKKKYFDMSLHFPYLTQIKLQSIHIYRRGRNNKNIENEAKDRFKKIFEKDLKIIIFIVDIFKNNSFLNIIKVMF